MNKSRTLRQALTEYIPEKAVEMVHTWFNQHPVILRITRSRSSKLGDFRGSYSGSASYISVNHNLNKYSFLITLLHEMAHAEVHFGYKRRMAPHGKAWKDAYRQLAQKYILADIFPENLKFVYLNYLINPQASSTTFVPLVEALREFDADKGGTLISSLKPDTIFRFNGGKLFRMGEKLRKRYRCICLDNNRTYLFNPLAVVEVIENQKTA